MDKHLGSTKCIFLERFILLVNVVAHLVKTLSLNFLYWCNVNISRFLTKKHSELLYWAASTTVSKTFLLKQYPGKYVSQVQWLLSIFLLLMQYLLPYLLFVMERNASLLIILLFACYPFLLWLMLKDLKWFYQLHFLLVIP